jgi:hypothetical protein
MCYSAHSSFMASFVLANLGLIAAYQARKTPLQMLSLFPLIFAFQQFAEGIVWLTMNTNYQWLQVLGVYIFLIIALIIWPLFVPLSLFLCEVDAFKKGILFGLIGFGVVVALYSATFFATAIPRASEVYQSICYSFGTDELSYWIYIRNLVGYCIPVVVPFFISSLRRSWFFGMALIISLAVTIIFKFTTLTSVWCFFAALLSVLILGLVLENKKSA